MQAKYQWYVGGLCFIIFLNAACAPQPQPSIVPATVVPSVTVNPTVVSSQTPSSNFVPKHNDLIFIEFFAVT